MPNPKNHSPLKALQGTMRADRDGTKDTQIHFDENGEMPKFLEGIDFAKEVWEEYAPLLQRSGLLTKADVPLFVQFCVSYGIYKQALEDMNDNSGALELTTISKEGGVYQNPLLGIMNKQVEKMNSILSKFGMNPSDRARMGVPSKGQEEKKSDPRDVYMRKNS